MIAPLHRRLLAEYLGSLLLAGLVIGSGIAAANLSPDDVGLQLAENAAATAAGLFAIILMFGPISGGHFNPVVSFVDAAFGGLPWRDALAYLPAQVAGCVSGAVVANLMFDEDAISISDTDRDTAAHTFAEVVATIGLLLVIFSLVRTGRAERAPAAVGAYIGAAYFFTSSTSFANPAITVGRMFSDSFAGIEPSSAPLYIVAQIVGGFVAVALIRTLYPDVTPAQAAQAILPHDTEIGDVNPMADKPSVLFVCIHNAGRSQMAAGWLRHLAGDSIEVRSAGSEPAGSINPAAVAAMAEVGIDIAGGTPSRLAYETVEDSDVVITMGCGDACPVFPGKRYEDWQLTDPAGQPLEVVRTVRDDIRTRVQGLLDDLLPASADIG